MTTTDCFRILSNQLLNVTHIGDTPCGNPSNGFTQCCRKGDQCLEDGICHFTRGGAGTSGYYVASCTDASDKDSSCLQSCNSNAEPDIVYSETDSLWHCCEANADAGTVNCSVPTNNTFQAPAPEKLATFASISTSTSTPISASPSTSSSPRPSSTTQSSPTANSTSSTSTASSTPSSHSGLSAGAKAGIGVGVALGVLCVVLLAIIIFLMKTRQRRQHASVPPSHGLKEVHDDGSGSKGTPEIQRPPELHGQAMKSELDPSRGAFHEL